MNNYRPIRVLHIIDHLGLGGAQAFLRDIAIHQQRSDTVVPSVCCLTEETWLSNEFQRIGIPLHHLNIHRRNPVQIASIPWRLSQLLRQNHYDLVHTHLFAASVFGRVTAVVHRRPTVIHEQNNETSSAGIGVRILDCLLGKKTDAVICVSKSTQDYNINLKGISPEKTWIIPNAVDTQRFSIEAVPETNIKRPDADHIVVGIGRLEPQKRFDIFLQAAQKIRTSIPDIEFLIVGDGSQRQELESLSRILDLQSIVHFMGAVPDIRPVLRHSDLFVLTSDYEGLPLTLLEALSMQVPSVATSVDGSREVLREGVGGILVPQQNPDAVAQAVISLLKNQTIRKGMGIQGRQLVQKKYSVEAICQQIETVYRTVNKHNRYGGQFTTEAA